MFLPAHALCGFHKGSSGGDCVAMAPSEATNREDDWQEDCDEGCEKD